MYNVKLSQKSIKQLVSGHYSSNNADSREKIINWLRSINTAYHLTLTFPYLETEMMCTNHLNQLLHMLNLRIFRALYSKKQSNYLEGVVVMEDTPEKDTVHFHIFILRQRFLPETEKMQKLVEDALAVINRGRRKKIDKFQLDAYRLEEGKSLEKYLTKVHELRENFEMVQNRFAYPSAYGLQFGEIGNSCLLYTSPSPRD